MCGYQDLHCILCSKVWDKLDTYCSSPLTSRCIQTGSTFSIGTLCAGCVQKLKDRDAGDVAELFQDLQLEDAPPGDLRTQVEDICRSFDNFSVMGKKEEVYEEVNEEDLMETQGYDAVDWEEPWTEEDEKRQGERQK